MSTSTIKIYTSDTLHPWKLEAAKLFKIEDIVDYLKQFTPVVISKFQYIHHALKTSIKLNLPQEDGQVTHSAINYVSIQNDSEAIVYYYVEGTPIRSQNCVVLNLVMDVLNTYDDGTDFNFKANTRIIREHKDRIIIQEDSRILTINPTNFAFIPNLNYEVGQIVDLFRGATFILSGEIISITYDIDDNLTQVKILFDSDKTDLQINALLSNFPVLATIIMNNNEGEGAYGITTRTYTLAPVGTYWRKIDFVSENINPLLQCGKAEGFNYEKGGLVKQDWYLLYRNQEDPEQVTNNPVECYLVPENATAVSSDMIVNGRLYGENLEMGKFYYVPLSVDDFTGHITPVQQTISLPDGTELGAGLNYTNDYALALLQRNSDNTINVYYQYYNIAQASIHTEMNYPSVEYITLNTFPCPYQKKDTYVKTDDFWLAATDMFNDADMDEWDETLTPNYLNSIEDLDRTEAKLIKLIKLPYVPFNFATGQTIDLNSSPEWEYTYFEQANNIDFYALKLKDLSTKLQTRIDYYGNRNPFKNLRLGYDTLHPSIEDLYQGAVNESKLYHSEFYKPTFVYDSFSMSVELEKCDMDFYMAESANTQSLKIYFEVTRTINSRFLFTIDNYEVKYSNVNFPKILFIARNNEEVLYSVPYIQYIKTGLNYDVKNKNISNAANWIGFGLSTAGMVASFFAPDVAIKAVGIVSSGIGMAQSLKGAITATIQNEESLKQKILQQQNQTSSVSGADDVDLMSEYAENRLKYFVYEPTPIMKDLLEKLFYYAGYNSGRMGIPTHNNRCNFDYLECDASLESVGSNISKEILEEIKNAYKNGVTYIHHTARETYPWDIEQKMENWEVALLED